MKPRDGFLVVKDIGVGVEGGRDSYLFQVFHAFHAAVLSSQFEVGTFLGNRLLFC